MKKILIILVCLVIVFTFSLIASSKIVLLLLSDMVEKSEIIAIGKIVIVEDTNEKQGKYSFSKVIIKVEKMLKGNQNTKNIDVYFFPNIEDEPIFSLKGKGIFFLYKYQNKNRLVQGHAGKVDIKNDDAINIYMLEQKRNQKIDDFVSKIEAILVNIKANNSKR